MLIFLAIVSLITLFFILFFVVKIHSLLNDNYSEDGEEEISLCELKSYWCCGPEHDIAQSKMIKYDLSFNKDKIFWYELECHKDDCDIKCTDLNYRLHLTIFRDWGNICLNWGKYWIPNSVIKETVEKLNEIHKEMGSNNINITYSM